MIDDETARRQLIESADRLFYSRGVQAVGMDAVRAEAGVSLKRIYALFPSKDELVTAVLQHRTEIWNDGIASTAADVPDPKGKLLAIFDFLDRWFREPDFRGCAFINVFGELGAASEGAAAAVRRQKRSFADYVDGLVREADLSKELGPQIVLLAEGAQTSAAILEDPEVAGQARQAAEVLIGHAAGVG